MRIRLGILYLQGTTSVIFGLPDLGSVCSEHVKSYMDKAGVLKAAGVDRLICVAVDSPESVEKWLNEKQDKLELKAVEGIADDTGAFTRMLGVDINDPDRPGIKCQRHAPTLTRQLRYDVWPHASPCMYTPANLYKLLWLCFETSADFDCGHCQVCSSHRQWHPAENGAPLCNLRNHCILFLAWYDA